MPIRESHSSGINQDYFGIVLSPALIPFARQWSKEYPREFRGKGYEFSAAYIADEKRFACNSVPLKFPHMKGMDSRIHFHVEPSRASEKMLYDVVVPTPLLTDMAKPRYSLYRINFSTSINHLSQLDETFSAFASGYVGVTKRPPIQRFREHLRDAVTNKGYLFHSSWRALLKAVPGVTPTFTIIERATSLDAAYDFEEQYVDKYTLAPKGLNAIPGGRAGLRFLGMRARTGSLPTPDERDAAAERFATDSGRKCAHYRIGHVRNLHSGKKTWVSPCWVNLSEAA